MDNADTGSEFDTLAVMLELEAAGVERKQAEAQAEALRASRAGLATKADLEAGLAKIRADLYRALWIQSSVIVVALAAAAAIVVALAGTPG